jgi:hypothetical protein
MKQKNRPAERTRTIDGAAEVRNGGVHGFTGFDSSGRGGCRPGLLEPLFRVLR